MTSYRYTITVSKRQNTFTSNQHIKDIAGIIGFASTHNLTIKTNEYTTKLANSNKLVEQYRNTAKTAVSKYIDSKAL